jgi:hypothetical protein
MWRRGGWRRGRRRQKQPDSKAKEEQGRQIDYSDTCDFMYQNAFAPQGAVTR